MGARCMAGVAFSAGFFSPGFFSPGLLRLACACPASCPAAATSTTAARGIAGGTGPTAGGGGGGAGAAAAGGLHGRRASPARRPTWRRSARLTGAGVAAIAGVAAGGCSAGGGGAGRPRAGAAAAGGTVHADERAERFPRASSAALRCRGGLSCLAGNTGTLVPAASPRGRCSLRGECCGRLRQRRHRPFVRQPRRRPSRLLPAGHEGLEANDFLVRQAGQRRALPRDTCTGADIDQLLIVDLELFGESVNTDGQNGPLAWGCSTQVFSR